MLALATITRGAKPERHGGGGAGARAQGDGREGKQFMLGVDSPHQPRAGHDWQVTFSNLGPRRQ